MKLHLTSRIVLFFMVLAAVLLTIVGVLAYRSGSKNLKAAAIAEMLATAVEKDAELNGWTDERLANLEHFTRHPNVVEIVTSLIASAPASAEARAAVRRELESQISGPHGGFTEVFLVEPDSGEVVVSTRLSAEGKSLSGQRYFENGKAGLYLQPAYYSADLGFPVMTVAAPLRAPDGRVVAVLAAHIDLAALTEMAQRRTGLRQTEDAFLINAKGFPITQPRFLNDPVALRRKFDTEVVRRCAAGNSGVILAADYRGVPSIAVYRWNASHHFGLIVKIDQAEALAPVRAFGRQVILISGLGLVASALLALFLARTITQPLRILQTDVQRFGKEENAPPLPESVGDEVGLLAREFNQMAAQVAERTAELRSAHAQLEQMLMHSPAVTYRLKVEGEQIIPITASANVTKLLGFALEETLSMEWWFEQLHPEDRDRATASIPEMLSQVTSRFEYRLRHKAGGYRWLDDQRRLLRDSNGQPSEIIGVWVDITERKQVEAALRSSEARSRSIIESAHDAFISLDVSGRIRDWNHQAEKIFGWPRAEALGRFLHETIIPEKHRAGHLRGISHLQATGEGAVLDQRLELTALRRNGEEFPLEMTIWALQMGDETIYNAFLHDITERKRLEAQLFESRKMEAVGKLAGGVAHEFNSILTAIIGLSELLFADLPANSPLAENATEITRAAQRAATLTRQLLAYGRQQFLHPKILDLNRVLAGMDVVLRELLAGKAVDLNIVPAPGLHTVKADAGQIEQVVVNLATNACEAMPHGGKLTLATANVTLGQDDVSRLPELKPGDYVRLSVTDTGVGMRAEVQARAFEPFFTTKDIGQGPGLGLSTCHGIVKQSGGQISVASEVGLGTTFEIYLPRLAETPDTNVNNNLPTPPSTGQETILLVEDEPSLRTVVQKSLTKLGYRVLEAATGVKALEVWKAHQGQIDLLLTDLMMPDGLNGNELVQRVLLEHPKLKVIYMSGYNAEMVGTDFLLEEGVNFLAKPFQVQKLAQAIRQSLDTPAVGT